MIIAICLKCLEIKSYHGNHSIVTLVRLPNAPADRSYNRLYICLNIIHEFTLTQTRMEAELIPGTETCLLWRRWLICCVNLRYNVRREGLLKLFNGIKGVNILISHSCKVTEWQAIVLSIVNLSSSLNAHGYDVQIWNIADKVFKTYILIS